MYGGADISDIRGIGGKQFASVQEWDPVPHCPGSHSFLNQNRKDWYKCYDLTSLASTQVGRCVLVPEGRRILAGGGTTGTASAQPPSPERATDQAWSIAPAGAGSLFGLFPVVLPPANIRCASGTKICVDTIETSSWPLRGLCQSWLVRFSCLDFYYKQVKAARRKSTCARMVLNIVDFAWGMSRKATGNWCAGASRKATGIWCAGASRNVTQFLRRDGDAGRSKKTSRAL